jgi:hypothetical protein
MHEHDTSKLRTLRKIQSDTDELYREIRLVRHASGRFAEVANRTDGVIALRAVPDSKLGSYLASFERAEGRNKTG